MNRDVAFSYQPTQPYYTLTDVGVTVTQRVTYSWDILGRVGWQALAYQTITSPGAIFLAASQLAKNSSARPYERAASK